MTTLQAGMTATTGFSTCAHCYGIFLSVLEDAWMRQRQLHISDHENRQLPVFEYFTKIRR